MSFTRRFRKVWLGQRSRVPVRTNLECGPSADVYLCLRTVAAVGHKEAVSAAYRFSP